MAPSSITAIQLSREIARGDYRPVYYFFGAEDYRKAEAVRHLLDLYIPEQQRLLNHIRLTIGKDDFGKICSEMAAIPMLGERRVVLIDEVQKLKPNQQKRLFKLLATPSPETVVILSSPAARTPDKKLAFFKNVCKAAVAVNFGKLSKGMATARIQKKLETAGFTCDREAVELLASMTGGDFGGLTGELEKLELANEIGSHIGEAEIKKIVSSYEEFSLFDLLDYVAEKKLDDALFAYNDLISKGVTPTAVLWRVSSHISNLIRIIAGKKIPGAPFYVNKLQAQARRFDVETALKAMTLIASAERQIRKSTLRPPIIVENLIREISR